MMNLFSFLDSSPQVPDSKRHDINVRTQLAGYLTGIRHTGLQKICAALNLPPPLEGRHNKRDKELLQVVQKFANESMSTAIQEAIDVAKSTDITVSGDGTWQTRGFSSKHGAADLISTCDSPKVVDIETCSKTCNVCLGTPEARAKYDQIIINHDCGKNFDQPSGNMEASSILKMFRRSEKKYCVRYVKYIGDGDSKTFSVLKTEIPYKGIEIQKSEDINRFGKRLKRALEVIKKDCGKEKLSDGKTIGGKGRLTDQMITRFQIYFYEAIRKNKNDLDKLYKSAQAMYWHKFSTNSDHHHQFCDVSWCGYLQAKKNNTHYDHTPHALPRAIQLMKKHGISDADDVSETSDQQNENNDDFDDDDYDDVSSTADTSFDSDETSHNNTDNEDDNNDDGNRQVEDLYYNPKSRKWKDSDEDN
ncbi:unnamed protein product [Rotaria sp. Silwood1]|nr:unnamed protein product [Rotaria sp. Silwood1]CAF1629268.1 unnamed protein product [Rotaria sp. Silwood1]CAF3780631.1 unnamed protein product [Rotaria sp. Silwood1]CAF3810454.1 unnamed protein product [Rotaria sp. Silwood1]CAF3872051.1 unnamed protein product [Rotaria sp. Silwood1]